MYFKEKTFTYSNYHSLRSAHELFTFPIKLSERFTILKLLRNIQSLNSKCFFRRDFERVYFQVVKILKILFQNLTFHWILHWKFEFEKNQLNMTFSILDVYSGIGTTNYISFHGVNFHFHFLPINFHIFLLFRPTKWQI